jgi:hypothetical protein
MSQATARISLPEHQARQLVLAEAVETADAQGKLIGPSERDAIDRYLAEAIPRTASADSAEGEAEAAALLDRRAARVLEVAGNRSPALAALAQSRPWSHWATWAVPLAAVLVGAATDRIANPNRVDLLSLPLIAIVLWNLVVYAGLLMHYVLQRPGRIRSGISPIGSFMQRAAAWQPRAGAAQARIAALFFQKWNSVTAALQAARVSKVLHLAAAGWALGIVLSLFARGLVVQYRIGWESTFLDAAQVHAILRGLLLPVVALLPFESFSVADVAALRFSEPGAAASTTASAAGARWVYLYASLLALVVMLPRLLLAAWARLREQQLSSHITLELGNVYYRRILALAHPARIRLGLLAQHDDDHAALLRALRPHAQVLDPRELASSGAAAITLVRAPTGEMLTAERVASQAPASTSHVDAPYSSAASSRGGWAALTFGKLRRASPDAPSAVAPPAFAPPARDAVLFVLRAQGSDLDDALPRLRAFAAPLLLLVRSPDAVNATNGQNDGDVVLCRSRAQSAGLDAEVLGFDSFARCWVQQPLLLDAIGRCLPVAKREGFARLAEAQQHYHRERFAQSMQAIAQQLSDAARDSEMVRAGPASITRLIRPSERQADAQAKSDAATTLAARLREGAHRTQASLQRLHGLDTGAVGLIDEIFAAHLLKHSAPVNAREAGMAGAATGAATGASVDLLTGGLTLGAAAALGALVGGGAALAGAVWKNRSTPTGLATVQAGDEMLHALLQTALLGYLDVVHRERDETLEADAARGWSARIESTWSPRRAQLDALWQQIRLPAQTAAATETLATEVQMIARETLHTLYPAAPLA